MRPVGPVMQVSVVESARLAQVRALRAGHPRSGR